MPKEYRCEGPDEVLIHRQGHRRASLRGGQEWKARRNHQLLDVLTTEIPPGTSTLPRRRSTEVRAALESKGQPIGPNDMSIAAHALSLGLVLVSDSVGEFKRVKGLKIENWREP